MTDPAEGWDRMSDQQQGKHFCSTNGLHFVPKGSAACACGELVSALSARPASQEETPVDPEQTLAMHLIQELKPDCLCAVCEVLREYYEETFGDGDPGG